MNQNFVEDDPDFDRTLTLDGREARELQQEAAFLRRYNR